MKNVSGFAALAAALIVMAPLAHAGLIGTVTISELDPLITTIYQGGTDSLAVGGSLSCPAGISALCSSGYLGGPATFTISDSTLSVSENCCVVFSSDTFNGFSFTGLTFFDGGSVGSVTLGTTAISGLPAGSVSFSAHSVFINLEGASVGVTGPTPGVFTLTLTEAASANAPEPASFLLLGSALGGLSLLLRRRHRA